MLSLNGDFLVDVHVQMLKRFRFSSTATKHFHKMTFIMVWRSYVFTARQSLYYMSKILNISFNISAVVKVSSKQSYTNVHFNGHRHVY